MRSAGLKEVQRMGGKWLCLGVALAGTATQAAAQDPVARPPLSPYLQLLRRQDGLLPNYQQFVRPRIEVRNQLQQGRSIAESLNRRISRVAEGQRRFEATGVRATGGAGGYMNFLHFYPSRGVPR